MNAADITNGRVVTLDEPGGRSAWIAIVTEDGQIGLADERGRFMRQGIDGACFFFRDGVLYSPGGSIPTVFSDRRVRTLADLEDAGFDAIESGKEFRALRDALDEAASPTPRDPHFGCDHQDAPCQVMA